MEAFLPPAILLLIFVVCTYYALSPLLSRKSVLSEGENVNGANVLELRKVTLYKQLRDVEFENEMGVVETEDFVRAKADLMSEVAEVMQEIEGKPAGAKTQRPVPIDTGIVPICTECRSSVEPGARFCSHCGAKLADTCPQCGAMTSPDDHFCAACGRGLKN